MNLKTRFTDKLNSRSDDQDWVCIMTWKFVKTSSGLTVYRVLICGFDDFVLLHYVAFRNRKETLF